MIRAYDEDWFRSVHPEGDLEAHIRQTLLASAAAGVKAAIFQYLLDQNPAPEVYDLLNQITAAPDLLARARVVTDRRWGTCTVLVTPSSARIAAGGIHLLDGTVDVGATLRYWSRHAEAILLQFAENDTPEERRPLVESLQWLTHWQFKRQFDQVLNRAAG